MSAAHEEVLYSDISEKTLHVGDVITLCVQREGKIFCVGSEGFVELTFFPILRTSSITVEDSVSNEHVLERVEALARTVLEGNERVEELLAKMSEGEGGPQ